MPRIAELTRLIDLLIFNWDAGIQALQIGRDDSHASPSTSEIFEVSYDWLSDLDRHQNGPEILRSEAIDLLMTNYVAWHILQKHGDRYDTIPLFFAQLHFLTESWPNEALGPALDLPKIAQDLKAWHKQGRKEAPYIYLKEFELALRKGFPPPLTLDDSPGTADAPL